MPFNRPALADLISRGESDLQSRLGVGPLLKRSFLSVIARMSAGAAHQLYGYLDWIARQVFVDTADLENLERHASIYGIARIPASYATGNVAVTVTGSGTIPAGTLLQRADGAQFGTNQTYGFVGSGTTLVAVTAITPGASGVTPSGASLQFVSPVAGVNALGAVGAGGLAGGADTETDASLRARTLARIRRAPNGGSAADYVTWALENAGVTRAWSYRSYAGPGTVGVAIVTDDAPGGPLPSSQVVSSVQGYIDQRRPVTADVTVFGPAAAALNLSITLNPNTQAVRNAVTAELADLLRRDAQPGGTILLSRIREAVSTAAGESDNTVTSPTANFTAGTGALPVLGSITFSG